VNLYRYVMNSVVNWVDFDGLQRGLPRNPNAPRPSPRPPVPNPGGAPDPLETPEKPTCTTPTSSWAQIFMAFADIFGVGMPKFELPPGAIPPPPPVTSPIPQWQSASQPQPDTLKSSPSTSQMQSQPVFSSVSFPPEIKPVLEGMSKVNANSVPSRVLSR